MINITLKLILMIYKACLQRDFDLLRITLQLHIIRRVKNKGIREKNNLEFGPQRIVSLSEMTGYCDK